ncbi:MAG: GNAT family N-acetyltransferase [Acholeplasmataceae bacterium]|jgi:RimJ/RimL family protein N-acetyltransferase
MIRKGLFKDKAEVLAIYEDAKTFIKSYNSPQWQDGYPNLDTFNNDIKNNRLYVYEIDGRVVACASFYNYETDYDKIYDGKWLTNDNNYLAIHTIAILKDFRGLGISNQFFEYAFNHFPISSIRIDTHELNIPMIKMLKKFEFKYCGIIYLKGKTKDKRLAFERLRK